MAGSRVIITGASRGLGAAIARGCAREGAEVVVAARSIERLTQVVDEVTTLGAQVHAMVLDVASEVSIEAFIDRVVDELGPIDVLVNNAGISPTFDLASAMRSADWDATFATNVRGPVLLGLAVARTMMSADRPGAIVNIASVSGLVPVRRVLAYSVSKAALIHATRCLALEFAPSGIRVNAVAPGYLDTDLTTRLRNSEERTDLERAIPLGRIADVEEVVEAVLYLASRDASYVTGSCMTLDGGYSLQLRWP